MRWVAVAILAAVAVGACGPRGDDGGASAAAGAAAARDTTAAPPSEESAPEEPPTLPPMEVTGTATDTIELRSEGPTLQFLPARISATSGERVLLRYENGGELPHNLALFRSEDAIDGMVTAAYEAQSSGYIPVSAADELIAYSPLLSPGETAEMEFVVPPPGRYTYICLFPGHAQMMLGTLTAR